MEIAKRIVEIKNRIAQVAQRTGRNPAEIKLVAVIKNVPLEQVIKALEVGIDAVGENRIQEALERHALIKQKFPQLEYHLIGHLQRNKVGQALDMFDIIQSVDSERLVEEINKRAVKPVPILIEVNTSGEATKFGIEPDKAVDLVQQAASLSRIKIQGLMTVGLLSDNPEKARSCFRKLKELKDKIEGINFPGVEMKFLSMGMTDDFEVAIEEGSNLIRIGRAIFGERKVQ